MGFRISTGKFDFSQSNRRRKRPGDFTGSTGTHPGRKEKKLEQLLEEFSILHIRNSKGMSLSGGERRPLKLQEHWQQTQSLFC